MDESLLSMRAGTAADIAEDLRDRIERGDLPADSLLPPVRRLADALGVNRNTVVAAYRQLATAGLVTAHGRAGTRVSSRARTPEDGYTPDTALHDVASGNPDPARIPSPSDAIAQAVGRPVLYGEQAVDPDLARFARAWMGKDLPDDIPFELTVTNGAVDAVERLLAQALVRDDAVALEDPCFLASIHTARLAGYRTVPVPVDHEGMTVAGLRAALDTGVRAIVTTPRAQNPTGVSLSAARAEELRAVLAEHPYVLIVEDDHFSLLSGQPFHSLVGRNHRRFALVRSVSKFFGPDLSVAVTATDRTTANRLALRLSPGTTWVSHILQRITLQLLEDPIARDAVATAGRHYRDRNERAVSALRSTGIDAAAGDGLNIWVTLPVPAAAVSEQLMRRGWLARTGDEFQLAHGMHGDTHLRLTLHLLADADLEDFVTALRASIDAAR